ncbi:MAG: hypothetical protein IJZ04_05155 [Clostridia bacterium]|nr:hypothetical protein [Clostridia bacterium]MBQ8738871.1 hypothetical protein [Clostridia bacterium]
MKKKFFINASVAVIGSSLLSLAIAITYFAVSLNIDEGHSLILFLGYMTDCFNAVSMFIGYATVIYAFFRFGFYEGVMSLLIAFGAFIPYFIYQSVAWNIYAEIGYDVVMEGYEAFSSALMGIYYSMGQGIINQILPSVLIGFIVCKVIKTNKDKPKKFISWHNRLQRAMIISCIALFAINMIMLVLTGILPELIELDFVMTKVYFNDYIVSVLLSILELAIVYLPLAYVAFMLTYKFYEYRLNKTAPAVSNK